MKWLLSAVFLVVLAAIVALGMRRRKPSAAPSPATSMSEVPKPLQQLDGYPFAVRCSSGAGEQAVRLANLTRDAYWYFAVVFPGVSPSFTATFLSPADSNAMAAGDLCEPGAPRFHRKKRDPPTSNT